jgi:hypothetical protein
VNIIHNMSLPTLMRKGMLRSQTGDDLSEAIPYEYVLDWFRQRERKVGATNRVLILKSETASGKSTLLPPKIYEAFVMHGSTRGIICTQPRVLTAKANVSQMLSNYKFLRLEDNVGWSTKEDKLKPKRVGLLSATIGTLTAQLKTMTDDEIASKYKFIMIDETHERSLETDMAMAMLKGMVSRLATREDCPFVVLMSATFDPDIFLRYYGLERPTNFIWCVGEAAGVDTRYINGERTHNDIIRGSCACVEDIIANGAEDLPNRGDILVFLPGGGEILALKVELMKLKLTDCVVLALDSGAVEKNTADFRAITAPLGAGIRRRIILSTAVAETGVTIDSLKYVIDAGLSREMEFNPTWHVNGLLTKPAPMSRVIQRRGRAGRKFRGVFYPLYPEHIYDKLPQLQLPTILTVDITPIMLDIIYEQLRVKQLSGASTVFDPAHIDMVDLPSSDALAWSMEQLFTAGMLVMNPPKWPGPGIEAAIALKNADAELQTGMGLSHIGMIAACLQGMELNLPAIRMISASAFWQAGMQDIISIAAYITCVPGQNLEVKRGSANWDLIYSSGGGHKQRHTVQCEMIDAVFLYAAIRIKCAYGLHALMQWCESAGINVKFAIKMISARDAIYDKLLTWGFDVTSRPTNIRALKRCIYEGYRDFLVTRGAHGYTHASCNIVAPSWVGGCKYFIAAGFTLQTNKKSQAMEVHPVLASVLDGYVPVLS